MENKKVHKNGEIQSYIIQKYIEKPLLYQNRKFDIRCFMLLTSINGILKAYFYQEGYVRTSSHKYSVHNLTNKAMHLTNDAIQKKSPNYGKFENANKLSFHDLQKYLDQFYKAKNINITSHLLPRMIILS